MKTIYSLSFEDLKTKASFPLIQVSSDIDLYWEMALSLYQEIRENNSKNISTKCIMPVGPVFQYRRFIRLLEEFPLDLSNVHFFFMDEYLNEETTDYICNKSSLSFHGFILRELINPMPKRFNLKAENIHFPDPKCPEAYDALIEKLGGIDLCHAGVGITGHLAFNEPISEDKITAEGFAQLGTRILEITEQTITINSNTALAGAWEEIPKKAITVGMKQILEAKKLRIYMNREWQPTVLRKAIMLAPTPEFPVTLAQRHKDITITVTPIVARTPEFALK